MTLGPFVDLIACPACGGGMALAPDRLVCGACEAAFPVEDDLPLAFEPHEWDPSSVTERIRSFYEGTPFPNYDGFDDVGTLVARARANPYARLLDAEVPAGATILECGCGTGQLSAFLSVGGRWVLGTDLSVPSLRLGLDFARRNGLDRVGFLQMNLFRPCLRPAAFDLVICNGVLHHTADPRGGLATLARLVRPGGYLLVGLYHRWGRIWTGLRRRLLAGPGGALARLDPRLLDPDLDPVRRETWFRDQYRNPHESWHTVGEVLGWLAEARLSFVRSVPGTRLFAPPDLGGPLLAPEPPAGPVERALAEASLALLGTREGGFFVVLARRPREEPPCAS